MKLLGIDSSSGAGSCALWEDGALIAENYLHNKLTHSQTLMPMVEQLLQNARVAPTEIDGFAVTIGPGSFTGIRIGIGTVKGMAFGTERPCYGLSTLEVLGYGQTVHKGIVCATMDARRQQVYTASFLSDGQGGMTRLCEDTAMSIEQLGQWVAQQEHPVMLTGDGAELCFEHFGGLCSVTTTPPPYRYQRASALMLALQSRWEEIKPMTADELCPSYLRLPQAERELLQKQGKL